jgi:hypothetical protein
MKTYAIGDIHRHLGLSAGYCHVNSPVLAVGAAVEDQTTLAAFFLAPSASSGW